MDDIGYLKTAGVEETYLFLADSSQRDKTSFPHANYYEVEFANPFRNVVGLDVVDVTFPRSDYTVDAVSNTLAFAVNNVSTTVSIEPGDYNFPQLVNALNLALAGTPLSARELTTPGELSNRIRFLSNDAFELRMGASGLRTVLGFSDPVVSTSPAEYRPSNNWSFGLNVDTDRFFSVAVDPRSVTAFAGPLPAVGYEVSNSSVVLQQRFTPSVGGSVNQLRVRLTSDAGFGLSATVVGNNNAVVATLAGSSPTARTDERDPFVLTANGGALVAGQAYRVDLVSNGAGCRVYYESPNVTLPGGSFGSKFAGNLYFQLGTSSGGVANAANLANTTLQLCVDVVVQVSQQAVTSPGVVDLTGTRYVAIRSPEIEGHIYRDRFTEVYHTGLAMVKLGGFGLRETRPEFLRYPSRTFHPIAKLSKLTIRVEKPDGSLYDTRGVDHAILFSVRYLVVPHRPAAPDEPRRVLYPDYDPDAQRWLAAKWSRS